MKRLALLSIAALSFTACGSDGGGQAATATQGDAFCKLAQTAKDDNDTLQEVDASDPAAIKLQLGAAIDSLSALAAKAPKDIVDTVKTLLANEEKLEGLLKDNDYDFEKLAATDEGKKLQEDTEIDQNGEELDAYLTEKCGIDTSDETDDTAVVDDTIAVEDTVVVDESVASDDTIVDLGEGEDAINQFLDFYELGTSSTLTVEDRDCLVSNLIDKVTGDDLNQAVSGEPSEEVKLALGQAFIDCEVVPES
jgi:hypothetical protein